MGNTQARWMSFNDAIERDRMARLQDVSLARAPVEEPVNQHQEPAPLRHWEPWLTIAIGLSLITIAAFY